MDHRPYLISNEDILDPPKLNINGRCYRQIPTGENSSVSSSYMKGRDTSQFHDEEEDDEEEDDGIVKKPGGGFSLEVQAAEPLYKFVMGRRGETKHRLETETKTQIVIPRQGAGDHIVIKGHDRSSIQSAKTRIELLLESSRWKLPFSHFLSFKMSEGDVVDGYKQFKDEVLEECKGTRGIDGSIFQQPGKLHLTLGTLVLLDEREVTAASKLLHQCRDTFISDLLRDGELNVDVEGLEYMNDDPNNVHILYAKVQLTDKSNRLQELADSVVNSFVKAGFMERQYDRVKLHCTVMNSIFRSDASGMRMEPERKKDQKSNNQKQQDDLDRQPFDASHLLKKLGNFHFGNVTLHDFHVSTRFTLENGYYRPAAKISF